MNSTQLLWPWIVISIWFCSGVLLLFYGLLILAQGLYELGNPPAHPAVRGKFHIGIWWGVLLLVLGGVYTVFFRPRTGE